MPYEIGTNACLQVQFEGRHAGQQVMNVMTYVYDGGATTEDGPLVIDEIDTMLTGLGESWLAWLDCLSEDVIECKRFYQWIHPIRYAWVGKGLDVETTGAVALPALPPNCSQAVTRRTNFAGREEVSTLKLPGVPAERVVDGFLTVAQMGPLQEFASASVHVLTLASGSKMVPIPWNRAVPGSANQLRTAYAHNTVRTMHRRTVGLGT